MFKFDLFFLLLANLGMLYLELDDAPGAILSLQSALRSRPDDPLALESLADAYKSRGSYSAALKAYDRVLALRPDDSIYAMFQIGTVKHLLGKYDEATVAFRYRLSMVNATLGGNTSSRTITEVKQR